MAMHNSPTDFYGRQENEKILYVVKPHQIAVLVSLVKIYLIAIVVCVVLIVLGTLIEGTSGVFAVSGIVLFLLIILIGTKITLDWQARNISYITDRRIVHFEPTTLFATNSRTLAWDEAVKVKTFPPNFIWKQMAIGNVVVHARTPIHPSGQDDSEGLSVDDIELKNVYFYRDLGNYIDKILFTYKQMPTEIANMRPFVLRPKGERY